MKVFSKIFLYILFVNLLFNPIVNIAQAPPLGITSTFAIFTAIGAINNNGTTNITGDVGTDVGALTGFPPGIIVGQVDVADAISAQAAIDVDAAYNFLSAVTCGSVIGSILGSNQVLTPNVYCLGSASTLNGNLILDGQGNPNSLFIFKINGALSTSIASSITLINSADLCNVYWQINGLFNLGDSSYFKGTVIANGAIGLLANATLEGRGLSRAGAISLNNNIVTQNCTPSILPIELISFSSDCVNQHPVLKWCTATEINNHYFIIERRTDKIDWETIDTIEGAGNSYSQKNYSFTDKNLRQEISYYRLKQIDYNREFKYSPIIVSENCEKDLDGFSVFPNPSSGLVNLIYKGNKDVISSISIYNTFGEKIYASTIYQSTIDFFEKQDGIYFLHLNLNSGTVIKKIVLQKF